MAKFNTRQRTSAGKSQTIARRTRRAVKYQSAARVSTAGRAR